MATPVKPALVPSSALLPCRVAFQGEAGAFSDIACRTVFPMAEPVPCITFEDAFTAVSEGAVDLAMIPIENVIAGRVGDVHHLIPQSGLKIVGEHFQPISMCLYGTKDSEIKSLTHVHSHVMALPQCKDTIRRLQLVAVRHEDTAGAAAEVARRNDPTQAAIASPLAGEIYGLKLHLADIQDKKENVTRFIVLSREPVTPEPGTDCITSLIAQTRNIPSALYKMLGAFATAQIDLSKIESYFEDGTFKAVKFYIEVDGHPQDRLMKIALDELGHYAENFSILGTYPRHAFRSQGFAALKK